MHLCSSTSTFSVPFLLLHAKMASAQYYDCAPLQQRTWLQRETLGAGGCTCRGLDGRLACTTCSSSRCVCNQRGGLFSCPLLRLKGACKQQNYGTFASFSACVQEIEQPCPEGRRILKQGEASLLVFIVPCAFEQPSFHRFCADPLQRASSMRSCRMCLL